VIEIGEFALQVVEARWIDEKVVHCEVRNICVETVNLSYRFQVVHHHINRLTDLR